MNRSQQNKYALLERLLEQGMVMVTLDARHPQAVVPEHLNHDAQLRLNLSYRFGLPLEVNPSEVRAVLTFGTERREVVAPWDAIYLLYAHATGEPYLFPKQVPSEVMESLRPTETVPIVEAPRLSVVQGGDAAVQAPVIATERRTAHLRVVK